MSLKYGTVTTEDELRQILYLQSANHASTLPRSQANIDGFVTVMHSLELLTRMNAVSPQVIAKDSDKVIGYALVMLRSFADMIPVLQPMFDRLGTINFENRSIADHSFYVMGQICIDKPYRGSGVFDALYRKHQELHKNSFELCVTSVATRNVRSLRAHERVGFKVVNTFSDATDEWNILVWRLQGSSSDPIITQPL